MLPLRAVAYGASKVAKDDYQAGFCPLEATQFSFMPPPVENPIMQQQLLQNKNLFATLEPSQLLQLRPSRSETSFTQRRYVCRHCSRAFKRSGHLQRHEHGHTNERPFPCPICPSSFGRRDLLLRHERTVHNKDPSSVSSVANMAQARSLSIDKRKYQSCRITSPVSQRASNQSQRPKSSPHYRAPKNPASPESLQPSIDADSIDETSQTGLQKSYSFLRQTLQQHEDQKTLQLSEHQGAALLSQHTIDQQSDIPALSPTYQSSQSFSQSTLTSSGAVTSAELIHDETYISGLQGMDMLQQQFQELAYDSEPTLSLSQSPDFHYNSEGYGPIEYTDISISPWHISESASFDQLAARSPESDILQDQYLFQFCHS